MPDHHHAATAAAHRRTADRLKAANSESNRNIIDAGGVEDFGDLLLVGFSVVSAAHRKLFARGLDVAKLGYALPEPRAR